MNMFLQIGGNYNCLETLLYFSTYNSTNNVKCELFFSSKMFCKYFRGCFMICDKDVSKNLQFKYNRFRDMSTRLQTFICKWMISVWLVLIWCMWCSCTYKVMWIDFYPLFVFKDCSLWACSLTKIIIIWVTHGKF